MSHRSHKRILHRLVARGAGAAAELPPELSRCAKCRREWESWRRLFGAMDAARGGEPAPAASLWPQVRRRLQEAGEVRQRQIAARRPAPARRWALDLLLRSPVSYGALGGLVLGIGLGAAVWTAGGENGNGAEDAVYSEASVLADPEDSVSADYFATLLDAGEEEEGP
ncbi:MAG: hypothetical protein GF355_16925 [Candidatus Eisenbacteria bacterium]|nr:hypothetical protein [Candidatus Eisenbacteria bacterium]